MTTQQAVEAGAPRWMALALPEDLAQEIALIDLEYPHLTAAARQRLVYHRCRELRYGTWKTDARRAKLHPRVQNVVLYRGPVTIGPRLDAAMDGARIVRRDSDRRDIVRWQGTANVAVDGVVVAAPVVIVDLRRVADRAEHMCEVIWTGDHARIHIWQPSEWHSSRVPDMLEITDDSSPSREDHQSRPSSRPPDRDFLEAVPQPIDMEQYAEYLLTEDLMSDDDLPTVSRPARPGNTLTS